MVHSVMPLLLAAVISAGGPEVSDYLLPNGEPIVGVYYYPWFGGEPYGHVGWHPELQFDNKRRPDHIREVIRAMADHGINQASYSYWGDGSLELFRTTLKQAEELLSKGWRVYFSPYMEPPTIKKEFADAAAQRYNIDRLAHFLEPTGRSPGFCRLGDAPFINIYVAYYRPPKSDERFRDFLRAKYKTIGALRAAWSMSAYPPELRIGAVPPEKLPADFGEITIADLPRGTAAFADLQKFRARALADGWRAVIDGLRQRTGLRVRFTGDNSNTVVSPVQYMRALTGLTWYSFGYALTGPTVRPKLISEISRFTGTTFLYTISPGYVDRQQRWPGGRVEHDPFLYEYAWVKAMQTLPEGIMILTHSEWYEGSIIDVTKEYGRRPYETTELYASLFKSAFADAFAHKRKAKPVAVVFNEWATYGLYDHGHNLADVYGIIKALECLSVDFDVIPETALSAEELSARRVVIVPSCGAGLHPERLRTLAEWVRSTARASVIVDATDFWRKVAADENVRGRVVIAGRRLGQRLWMAFNAAWLRGRVPMPQLEYFERLLSTAAAPREVWPDLGARPSSSFEVARGPVVWAGSTALVTVANTIPWGYITQHRKVGWGKDRDHFADTTWPWRREKVTVRLAMPRGRVPRQVVLLDSDAAPWTHTADPSAFFSWSYNAKTGVVAITTRCKFHAVFAVVTGQAALRPEGLMVYPGGQTTARVVVANLSHRPLSGRLIATGPPDLHVEPVRITLAPRQRRAFDLVLRAGPDCAVGVRTLKLVLQTEDGAAVYWARLQVTPPALVGLKTSLVAVPAGKSRRVAMVVSNVGPQPARDVSVEVGGPAPPGSGLASCAPLASAAVALLQPDEDAAVIVQLRAPEAERLRPLPAVVSWSAGPPPQEDGMRALSAGDGITVSRRAAGVLGVEPDPSRPPNNRYIYFDIDAARIPPGDYAAEAEVEFFDDSGSFIIEYDSALGDTIEDRYRDSAPVVLTGRRRWRTAVVKLPHARFGGRQNFGADLRISGRVLVRRLVVRPAAPKNTVVRVPVRLSWRCGSARLSTIASLRILQLVEPTEPPSSIPSRSQSVWVTNPFGDAVPEAPVAIPRAELAEELARGPVAVYDAAGRRWPAEADEQGVRAVVPLRAAEQLFIARPSEGADRARTSQMALRDRSAGLNYVAVENEHFAALWDGARGGVLASLICKGTGAEYAAPAGLCTVEYTLPDRSHEVSSRWPGTVQVAERGVAHVDLVATARGPHMTVRDRWRIYAACRFMRLRRTITITRRLAAADFCPLVVRLSPAAFDRVFPLGVGFTKDGNPPRGWLETWHSEGWYVALSGYTAAPTDALALAIARIDGLRRVRYGFIPADELPEASDRARAGVLSDELQLRFRARCDFTAALGFFHPGLQAPEWWRPAARHVYEPGERVGVQALVAVARGCPWQYARELALIDKYGVAVALDGQPPVGGIQIQSLRRPLYMYRVHPPRPSAELAVQRLRDFAPEIVLPAGR